ncbi:MAG: caspase family protein [Planctomycetota bacterium]
MSKVANTRVGSVIVVAMAAVVVGPAWGVGWDDIRTIDFEEYKQAPRYTVGSDPWINIDSWDPPEGWTDPINHRKNEIGFTDVRGFGFEWDGPRPDTFDLTRWSKRVRARGDVVPFGPTGISPAIRDSISPNTNFAWSTKLNVQSLDIAVDLNGFSQTQLPASGMWRGTVHGYRQNEAAESGTPERWPEVFTKEFDLPLPTRISLGSGNASYAQTSTNFVTVELPGFSQLDRLAFSAVDPDGQTPDITQFAVDNIKASAGATHAFFLGAPDGTKIDSRKDVNLMRGAMKTAFEMESDRSLILPEIESNSTPANAADNVFAQLDQFKDRLAPGDNFVFYYSGHGVSLFERDKTKPQNRDEALVLGYDSNEDPVYLHDDELADYFAGDPIWSQVDKVFILDACYSGGFWTSTPAFKDFKGREDNTDGPTDLGRLSKAALLAAAPEALQGVSWDENVPITAAELGLPGVQNIDNGQGLLTAAVLSALTPTQDGYLMADVNDDGLSFRELLEYVRVSGANELFGTGQATSDDLLERRMQRWLRRNGREGDPIGWLTKSRFVGFERSLDGETLDFEPWSDDPIEIDWSPFASFSADFGTAGMMEPMTLLEIAAAAGGGLAGDFNNNGQVEQGDLNLVLSGWGLARGAWSNADAFTTPNVDQEELNAVLSNWGSQAAPNFEGFAAVPEPGLLGFGAGTLVMLMRKRR